MTVVEAAGYDVILVETVGVGQSETAVADMTDTFLLLALARTGDQLQGIKKGVLELADVIAVSKAGGPHERDARTAARELRRTLQATGRLTARRNKQQVGWTWQMVRDELIDRLRSDPAVRELAPGLEHDLREGKVTATTAAQRLLDAFADGTRNASGI